MNVLLCGALGKMGKTVDECIEDTDDIVVAARVDSAYKKRCAEQDAQTAIRVCECKNGKTQNLLQDESVLQNATVHCYENIDEAQEQFDVIIDFSAHIATISILKVAIVRRCAVVVATTGHTDAEKKYIEYASNFIPLFYSNNMSIGIAALEKSIKDTLSVFKSADVEIIETHHVEKRDVPSGTALMLANAAKEIIGGQVVVGRHENGKKKSGDIGIHSLRMGSCFGEHEVRINTGDELLVFKHEALSRKVYARGAIEAARFIANKPAGLYGVGDLF